MPSNFLKKSWSDLMTGKTISLRLGELTHRYNNNKNDIDQNSTTESCDSPTSSDVSYLSSPPTSPTTDTNIRKTLTSTLSPSTISSTSTTSTTHNTFTKRNSVPINLRMQLDKSTDSIDCTPSITILKESSITNFKRATPEFDSVTQLVKYYKQLQSFCLCSEGKEMLTKALRLQKKEEQVQFIELIDNIADKIASDRINVESLRDMCSNICNQFLRDGSEFQLNVSNIFIRKFEELNNTTTPKEDFIQWIDSVFMEVIVQMNTETFYSIKKTEEFRVWLLSKALDWVSSREQLQQQLVLVEESEMTTSQFLEINGLSEYDKLFKKKKLNLLSDLKHMTDQNDFKQLGILKLGHQKKLARLVRESFTSNDC